LSAGSTARAVSVATARRTTVAAEKMMVFMVMIPKVMATLNRAVLDRFKDH
jgi:hypothetical protein